MDIFVLTNVQVDGLTMMDLVINVLIIIVIHVIHINYVNVIDVNPDISS